MTTESQKREHELPEALQACRVSTPQGLATAMVSTLDPQPGDRWLEPCIGDGALLTALVGHGVETAQIRGIDLETRPCAADGFANALRGTEFLAWASKTDERFDKIVANPPFASLSRVPGSMRMAAVRVAEAVGLEMPQRANCWYAFLCASLRLLKVDGSLAFVLPASWDFADYCGILRENVQEMFGKVSQYRCKVPLFRSVQEGAIVLVAEEFKGDSTEVLRGTFQSPEDLIGALRGASPEGTETAASKHEDIPSRMKSGRSIEFIRLDKVLNISIGGVTGDVSYFLLTESERREHNLPKGALRPVVSRARHLTSARMTSADWARLRDRGERIWLFRPSDAWLDHVEVQKYLERPIEEGGCDRSGYKVSRRPMWHRTVMPSIVHGFMSGMTKRGPWIALREMPELSATNTLYIVRFREASTEDERAALGLALLSSETQSQLEVVERRYADGLRKFEPGDLGSVMLPVADRTAGAAAHYSEVVDTLLNGCRDTAVAMADSWID